MKANLTILLFAVISGGWNVTKAQNNSVLVSGDWYKIRTEASGLYKIDRNLLEDMGIAVSSIDPRNISLHGYGGGMLPQENSFSRPEDLPEVAIEIVGESDGSFDSDDYILFYAESSDRLEYQEGELIYENNLYDDYSYFFITVGNNPGKRIISVNNEGTGHQLINSYNDYFVYEEDLTNLIGAGREWYGQILSANQNTLEIDFPVNDILENSTLSVTSSVMAQSFDLSTFELSLNGSMIGDQLIGSIPDEVYDIKGVNSVTSFEVEVSTIDLTSGKLDFVYTYQPVLAGTSLGYHNYLLAEVERQLTYDGNSTTFRSLGSTSNNFSTFEIAGANSEVIVWDITDKQNVLDQAYDFSGSSVMFGAATSTLREYIVFEGSDFNKPEFVEQVDNQNLHGIDTPDGLIVTHPMFQAEAIRLASFRSSHDGLDIEVVTTDQIYNEFASGRQDISAIRDFIKHLYDQDERLKYVLLFGDASYDYKERTIADNTNFVPIYEARNSLHPIFSYSSDDFFGFMDDNEGLWEETLAGDHQLDLGVGRLPSKSLQEASDMVDKIIGYATDNETLGNWRNELVFVADDGDANIHQADADRLAQLVDSEYAAFNPNKIYVDAFTQIPTPNGGQSAESVTQAINEAIEKGSLIFNFTGHGNENLWCHEAILDQNTIRDWDNRQRLPLFVTATCEFGRYDNPDLVSGGELLLLSEQGGAVAVLTTSRPVFSNTNFLVNQAFYNNVFKRGADDELPRLGDVIRLTKNESLRGPVNRNFSLLGDPMMKLAYPAFNIEITELNGEQLTMDGDTIRALGLTEFHGEVQDSNGERQNDFSGVLSVKVFDTPTEFVTLGNESPPTTFKQRNSVIFRGDVTISNGEFDFSFVVPKNITYLFDEAKISLYARAGDLDGNGANINLKIGGSDPDAPDDLQGPDLDVFLNDETFRSGDETGPNPLLLAKVFDQNGINMTELGIGQQISATLDGTTSINLNDFYVADLDSYQSGTVRYPLSDLTPGEHSIEVRVFDTYNNSTTTSINFFVGVDAKRSISSVISYPNPMRDETTFRISHNRLGENLELTVDIFDLNGDLVQSLTSDIFDNTGTIDEISWNRTNVQGGRVREGMYISRIILKTRDGVGTAHHKLIVID